MNRNLVGSIYGRSSCLLMNRDEMTNLHRGPSIYAPNEVSIHLAKRFQRRRFKIIGQSETRIAYGGHVCTPLLSGIQPHNVSGDRY
jgi:hypothetical protein